MNAMKVFSQSFTSSLSFLTDYVSCLLLDRKTEEEKKEEQDDDIERAIDFKSIEMDAKVSSATSLQKVRLIIHHVHIK
jgi:hypothetical protein